MMCKVPTTGYGSEAHECVKLGVHMTALGDLCVCNTERAVKGADPLVYFLSLDYQRRCYDQVVDPRVDECASFHAFCCGF